MVPNLVDSAKFISNFLLSTREVSVVLGSMVVAIFFSYCARDATSLVCLL
jgi:hypothetical protein